MNDIPGELEPEWEERINALLDGELDKDAIAALESAARENPRLARALDEYRHMQQLLEAVPAVAAPRSLRRKLLAIPAAEEPARLWSWWQRGALVGAVALALLVVTDPDAPGRPSELEIAQGRRDLALALSYLSQATERTNSEIRHQISGAVIDPVTRTTMETLKQQFHIEQEYYL
jgi:hypothetical protein